MANTKPKKILAVMLSLVLAFSVMSVSALTAFADYVATLTPANGLVYDTVYGVFGGEYALMTKTVVFKGVYDWAPGMDPVDMRGSVTDIVDADGNVVLHSFSAAGTVTDADKHPETKADWTIGSLRGLGHDMEAGTIVVRSTSTQLYGVVTPEGKQVIPAQYKNIGAINEDIYGFNASGNKATIDLFDGTGKSLGSFTFTSAYSSQPNMSGGPRDWMTVVKRDPYVVVSDSMTDIGIIYKQDGKYVKATAKRVYSADADGNALLRESDDYAYLQLANGNKVRLAKVADDSYASFDGPFVTVRGADGTSATKCFTREGKLVGDGKLPFCSIVDNYALLGNWDGRSDESSTCALFDASGNKVNEFESDYAKLFFKGTRTYNNNGPSQKLLTADGTYYCFSIEDPYDSDDGYFYNLRVYGIDGKLVKDLGKGFEYPEYMSEVTAGTRSDGTSKSTVLGYEVTIEWGSDRY